MKKHILLLMLIALTWYEPELFSAGYTRTPHGLKTQISSITVEINFFTPDIVHITKAPVDFTFYKKSAVVLREPENVNLRITEKNNLLLAESNELILTVDKKTGAIHFTDKKGRVLLTEKDAGAVFHPKKDGERNTF